MELALRMSEKLAFPQGLLPDPPDKNKWEFPAATRLFLACLQVACNNSLTEKLHQSSVSDKRTV
jgi:hypothetical protein